MNRSPDQAQGVRTETGALASVNPTTGTLIESYPEHSGAAVEEVLQEAARAFREWRDVGLGERASRMKAAARGLRQHQDTYARLMAVEMGKPLAQGRSEVEKCALTCDYYAEQAGRYLSPEQVQTEARMSYVTFQPLGVVLAVMPWNFPFWQVIRFAAPALMAGNAGVLKHASNVTGCALALELLFSEAGFPRGLFRCLLINSKRVAAIIDRPVIKAVTLTGSDAAGRAVAARAGTVLKKTVLELGGSDPYVVLADADLEHAAQACVASRLINGGQSCIAAKRFVVVEAVRRQFEGLVVEHMRNQCVGDPLVEGVTVGPLARFDLRDELHQQVLGSLAQGARLLLGGEPGKLSGAFYPPTVLTNVGKGMPVYEEETFGPVAAVIPVSDESQAIRVANDTSFGLGAAVFTRDLTRGERIAASLLEAGSCFVNTWVRSDPRLPFGGIKGSGYGRELSAFGIREFVNIKTVYIA
jgi:succinate-semialdehyde dehydrogenase/glutarate-semialdehyde dehydrogenase